jgi:hypothetical protein
MNADMQVLIPVFTVLFAGVVSAIVTYALNTRKAERETLRQKLEALFTHAHKYTTKLWGEYFQYFPVVKGEMTLNDLYDTRIKNAEKYTPTHEQIEMLISIYFPKVQKAYDDLVAARDQLSQFNSQFVADYKRGTPDKMAHLNALNAALKRLEEADNRLRETILAQAKWINRPWWRLR